jgi:hypothetical protein
MGLLLDLLQAVASAQTPAIQAVPQRRRNPRGRPGRWRRRGPARFHVHLTPGATRYHFTRQFKHGGYRWLCPFCGMG